MRTRFCWIVVAALFAVLAVQGAALAAIGKCKFDVWTTNETDANGNPLPLRVDFYIELEDSVLPPPEALSLLKITAPDDTEFDYSSDYWKYWTAGERFFFFYKKASAFPGGTIPTGKYKLTVTSKSTPHRTVINTDTLTTAQAAGLPKVKLVSPEPNGVLPLKGTLRWSWDDPKGGKVPGAQYYRVLLMEDSGNKNFVYDSWKHNPMWIYGATSLTLPTGALQAGYYYWVRIEARDSDKNLGRRSRTPWVRFQAGN